MKFSPLRHKALQAALFVAAGALTGLTGWSGQPLALALGVIFPALWAFAPSRLAAALVAFAYFLGASRGLPVGVSVFFGAPLTLGLGLWLAASVPFVAVHAALWTARCGWQRPVRYGVAALLMSLPPFGIVGWAHPVTAAGILFPGWAWFGLAATFVLLLAMTTRIWPCAAGIAALAFAVSAPHWTPPVAPEGWRGINTAFKVAGAGQYAGYAQQMETVRLVRAAAADGVRVAVLPESALGLWGVTTERLWTRELADLHITVIAGGTIVDAAGYDNAMLRVSGTGATVLYRERMPVPVSMWQPWRMLTEEPGGARAHLFANPAFDLAGLRIAPLICYEQLIVWPVIQSMLHGSGAIVATGNAWWTGGGNIATIQRSNASAWAALFDVPLVVAFNE